MPRLPGRDEIFSRPLHFFSRTKTSQEGDLLVPSCAGGSASLRGPPPSRLPTPRRPGLGAVFGRTARGGSRAVPRRRRRGARPAGCSRPPSRGLGLRKGKGERGKGLAKKIRPKISRPQTVPHAAVVKRYAFFSPALFGPVGRISPPRRGARKLDRGCRACARRGRPAESADSGKLLPANPPRRFVGLPGEMSLRGAASARQGRYAAPPRSGTRFFPIPFYFLAHKDGPGKRSSAEREGRWTVSAGFPSLAGPLLPPLPTRTKTRAQAAAGCPDPCACPRVARPAPESARKAAPHREGQGPASAPLPHPVPR